MHYQMLGVGNKIETNMHKLSILLFLISFASFGQESAYEDTLISRFRPGFMWFNTGLRPAKPEKVHKYDRLMVGIQYNHLLGKEKVMSGNPMGSLGFHTQWVPEIPLTKHNTVSFGIGLGYAFQQSRLEGSFLHLNEKTDFQSFTNQNVSNVEKATFRSHHVFVPIELRVRSKGWKHVKFHFGGQVGWQFGAKMRTVFSEDSNGMSTIASTKGYTDYTPLHAAVIARVGIRNWAVGCVYHVQPVFRQASNQLNLLEFQLSLSLF